AKQANVEVDPELAAQQADQNIQAVVQQYGSDQAFDAALAAEGLTRAQYREILIDQFRSSQLLDAYLRQMMANRTRPLVSEEQLRAAFAERSDALGQRPVRVSLQQVVIPTEPGDSAPAEARRTAE